MLTGHSGAPERHRGAEAMTRSTRETAVRWSWRIRDLALASFVRSASLRACHPAMK